MGLSTNPIEKAKNKFMENMAYISFEDATTPKDGEVLTDRWWVVDPEKGLLVWKKWAYQCNRDKAVTDMIAKKLYPGLEVRHFDVVYTGRYQEV